MQNELLNNLDKLDKEVFTEFINSVKQLDNVLSESNKFISVILNDKTVQELENLIYALSIVKNSLNNIKHESNKQ